MYHFASRTIYLNLLRTHLIAEQESKLPGDLCSYADVFAESEFDIGQFTAFEHAIGTGDASPLNKERAEHLKKMLDEGVIQESVSEWASSPVFIRMRDGSFRWCIDYRALNDVTVKDTFPLPLVEDCLDALAGNIWFSKLDANSAYWQVKVKEGELKKTAFLTKF